MSVKTVFVVCAHALFIQSAFSYCVSGGNYHAGLSGYGLRAPALATPAVALPGNELACGTSLGYGAGPCYSGLTIEAIPTSGGGLSVTSISAIAPSGLTISSENVIEGVLSVSGELPFLGGVALEGVLPSGGAGAVSYSCGNGITAIESIAPASASVVPAAAVSLTPAAATLVPGLGYGSHISHGCGCSHY